MSAITTHVLDTSRGLPAADVGIVLDRLAANGTWMRLAAGSTDGDGRLRDLLPSGEPLTMGVYRLTFDTGSYQPDGLYPEVAVAFHVRDPARHYHIPLLLNPYGYSTYRGS
ncbi:MAG: hydroxyisourate hydrolase [Bryobacteraceae bacterium]